jgi:hypothetical protein
MAMILFKNGTKLAVPQEVLTVLNANLKSKETRQFQGLVNEKNEVVYIINMDEIIYMIGDSITGQ